MRLTAAGWVHLTQLEAKEKLACTWTMDEVVELVNFVIDNGYVKRGSIILKQVKGFGMGLACAGQIANLGCYPVERDFADKRSPSEVEHNGRFIDDILTLTGCIPSEEEYGMQHKTTSKKRRRTCISGNGTQMD